MNLQDQVFLDKPKQVQDWQTQNQSNPAIQYYKRKAFQYYRQTIKLAGEKQKKSKIKTRFIRKKTFSSISSSLIQSSVAKVFIQQFCVFGVDQNWLIQNARKQSQFQQPKLIYSSAQKNSILQSAALFPFHKGVGYRLIGKADAQQEAMQSISWKYSVKQCFHFTICPEGGSYKQNPLGKIFIVCIGCNEFVQIKQDICQHQRIYAISSSYPYIEYLSQAKALRFSVAVNNVLKADSRCMLQLLKQKVNILPISCMQQLPFQLPVKLKPQISNIAAIIGLISEQILSKKKLIIQCDNGSILTRLIFLLTQQFLRPFIYPFPIIYLLPAKMSQYSGSPMPLIIGTTGTLDIQEDDICYLVINTKSLKAQFKFNTGLPGYKFLQNRLKPLYNPFYKQKQTFSNLSKKKSSPNLRPAFQDLQQQATQIASIIKNFIKKELTDKFPQAQDFRVIQQNYAKMDLLKIELDKNLFIAQKIGHTLLQQCKLQLKQFMQKFIQSQIFYSYIDQLIAFQHNNSVLLN